MNVNEAVQSYLKHLQTLGRSLHTIKGSRSALKNFAQFLEQEHVIEIEDLTTDVLEEYQQDLAFKLTAKGALLCLRTQGQILGIVKGFTCFLKNQDYLLHDPGAKLKLPRKPRKLPKAILNAVEVKKLMAAPDIRTNNGYRNRVMLEILYDTAIRRAELAGIKINDIDLNSGFILICGKGDKERVVPMSKKVCELVKNYTLGVRPSFINEKDNGYLFLNRWGDKMDANAVWAVVKNCVSLAKIKKNISTHSMRHTCATHMLKNGAPVRHLQEMLGHESLESTQIYTHVTINDLKEIHKKYHPSENP